MKKSFKMLALMYFVILTAVLIVIGTSAAPIPGDVNGDGKVTVVDSVAILLYLTGKNTEIAQPCYHTGTVEFIPEVEPTYTEIGFTLGAKCTKCGEVLIAQEVIPVLPAAEHTEAILPAVPANCTQTGLTEGKYCTTCNKVLVEQQIVPKTACNYESVIIAPTCEEQGYTIHTCSVCGKNYTDTQTKPSGHAWGEWEVSGSDTIRKCINPCNCGKSQRVTAISATYNGIRLLTGESVWKDDITVTISVSDNTTFETTDFTLQNEVMLIDGNNVVTVTFVNKSTTVSVPAIYDNLPNTTAASEFEISDADKDAITITKYIGTATDVVIPAHINRIPVRYIGESAFNSNKAIQAVTIPSSIKSIGLGAFYGCSGLKTLNLNEGLITIKGKAFMNCPITKLVIPNSVQTIDTYEYYESGNWKYDGAFEGCKSLAEIVIGNGLIGISRETFSGCSALKDIVIGSSVQTISDYAFANCTALQTINIPDNVINIGPNAFKGCVLLTNFRLGTGVQSIGASALQDCTSLNTITIPANVQTMGNGVFTNCTALEETVIEKGVLREIGSNVYSGCTSFDRIYYTGSASDWGMIAIGNNSHPLNVTPYYYTQAAPSTTGNYWYYNTDGEKRVWKVNETSFKAEEYSEKFAKTAFGDETTSYSSQLLKELKKDDFLQAQILIWEGLNTITDFESKLITKKDVYKLVIFDLLMGDTKSTFNPYDLMADAMDFYLFDIAEYIFDKDIKKIDLELLKTLSPDQYDCLDLTKRFFDDLEGAELIFKTAGNMYDAVIAAAQYLALADMDENFYLILQEIANDSSLPSDLRIAASESAEAYGNASASILAEVLIGKFATDTAKDVFKKFYDFAWKETIGKIFPQLVVADLAIKGIQFIGNAGFNLDNRNEAYYQLEAAVGLENALRNIIKDTLPDYLRYNYKGKSEYYMYAIDMYQTSVLLGYDYSSDLLKEYSKGWDVSNEEEEYYKNTMAQLVELKESKKAIYENFDNSIEKLFIAYYS